MHTIYLSDLLEVQANLEKFDMNMEYQIMQQYLSGDTNIPVDLYFEEMPVCPMCLEKIDTSASGLQFCMLFETYTQNSELSERIEFEDNFDISQIKEKQLEKVLWPLLS